MKKLEFKTLIKTSQQELFDFHLDTNNIKIITPKDIKVELLNAETKTHEGKIVKLKTTKMGIPTYWEVLIEKMEEPKILVDVAIKSPFKYWKHEHIFEESKEGTYLIDRIEFNLGIPLIGCLIESLLKLDIKKMFHYRHNQTKKYFEKD